jgi:hypothetical protein
MPRLRRATLSLGLIWALALGYVIWSQPTAVEVLWGSLIFVAYYVVVSIYLSRR